MNEFKPGVKFRYAKDPKTITDSKIGVDYYGDGPEYSIHCTNSHGTEGNFIVHNICFNRTAIILIYDHE